MSKLPNAPLVEVIFELRWRVSDKEELTKCQYLHGDLYALLKDDFRHREALIAPEVPIELYINSPAHRFRFAQNDYPLVQIGPGLVTVNTIDAKYHWEDFEKSIITVVKNFLEVYQFNKNQEITIAIQYFDFFEFDFGVNDVYEFLSSNLNVSIKQMFFENKSYATNLNLLFNYNTDLGSLAVTFVRGKNTSQKDGIIMQTSILSNSINPNLKLIVDRLRDSHEFCSNLFKEMTKGKLYESFRVPK